MTLEISERGSRNDKKNRNLFWFTCMRIETECLPAYNLHTTKIESCFLPKI